MLTLRCAVLRANPPRLTDIRWFRNGGLIRMPMAVPVPDLKETPELRFKLEPTNNGTYECRVSSSVGTSTCTFNVSGESGGPNGQITLATLFSFGPSLAPQRNLTTPSSTTTRPTQSASRRGTTTPTTCSGRKKIPRPQTASSATG